MQALARGVDLHPKVTYFIGENGSGKSTLLEVLARASGMPAEGGSSNFAFPSADDDPAAARAYAFSARGALDELVDAIRTVRTARRPRTDFFLRAESLFAAAAYLVGLTSTFHPLCRPG